ncbi:MAG: hemerythrin domain-containing protein [Candidatus Binataceae bacterium]|jgi:hemerythrin-like domain-containing protein
MESKDAQRMPLLSSAEISPGTIPTARIEPIFSRGAVGRQLWSQQPQSARLKEYWGEFIRAAAAYELAYEAFFTRSAGYRFSCVDRLPQFILALRRHIRSEEDCLFQLFEHQSRMHAALGPMGAMRAEHREIEAILGTLGKLLSAGDCATVVQTIDS